MESKTQRRRERQDRRHRQWFHQYEIEYLIRREYSGCPEIAFRYFVAYICTTPKNWRGAPIAETVDATIRSELRHSLKGYELMVLVGFKRKAARRRVHAMIAIWKNKSLSNI